MNAASSSCESPRSIHTIGHSTRTIDAFIDLLKAHHIRTLVDVRRWPASRRHPHFHGEALAAALKSEQIGYLWRGDLGGFRRPAADSVNTAWRVGAFRAYADFMLTPEFEVIAADLERLAVETRMAIMCAEAVPWRCHRQLIADAFSVRHWAVRHILDSGCTEHALPPFAQVEGLRIFYRGLL